MYNISDSRVRRKCLRSLIIDTKEVGQGNRKVLWKVTAILNEYEEKKWCLL